MSEIKLYNDDCLNVLKNMPDKCIDLVVVDPPYLISNINGGGSVNNVKKLNKSLEDLETDKIVDGYDIEKIGEEFMRIMKEPNIYLWCNKKQIPDYFNFYVNKYSCKFDIICWHKPNALPTYSNKYLSDTEYLLYFRKGKGKCFPQSYEDAKTYYIAPINQKDKKLYEHPTIKPLDITEKIIRNSSRENDIILDCFMGSGTTGVACKELNRNFVGIEISEKYFNIAKERIDNTKEVIKEEKEEVVEQKQEELKQEKVEQVSLF